MNPKLINEWLHLYLAEQNNNIRKAAIFGSLARNSVSPNDCDLLIVSNVSTDSEEWQNLRNHISLMKSDFLLKFSLPLNVTLLTVREWNENRSIFKNSYLENE